MACSSLASLPPSSYQRPYSYGPFETQQVLLKQGRERTEGGLGQSSSGSEQSNTLLSLNRKGEGRSYDSGGVSPTLKRHVDIRVKRRPATDQRLQGTEDDERRSYGSMLSDGRKSGGLRTWKLAVPGLADSRSLSTRCLSHQQSTGSNMQIRRVLGVDP